MLTKAAAVGLVLAIAAPVGAAEFVPPSTGGLWFAAAATDTAKRGPKLKNQAFLRGSEIRFEGRTILDPSLEVGFHAEVSPHDLSTHALQSALAPGAPSASGPIFVYVKSGVGTIALGDRHQHGAVGALEAQFSSVSANDGVSLPMFRPLQLYGAAGPAGGLSHVSYFTPRLGGMQFGVSFKPGSNSPNSITLNLPPGAFQLAPYDRGLEFSANYRTEFKGLQVELGGSYLSGNLQNDRRDKLIEWGAGGAFGYVFPNNRGNLALAGSYQDNRCDGLICNRDSGFAGVSGPDSKSWNLGLRYQRGSWALGGYYLTGQRESIGSTLPNQTTTVFLQTAIGF